MYTTWTPQLLGWSKMLEQCILYVSPSGIAHFRSAMTSALGVSEFLWRTIHWLS